MGGFLVSEEFKTMMLSTTTAVVSEVMSNTIESLVKKEIEASACTTSKRSNLSIKEPSKRSEITF